MEVEFPSWSKLCRAICNVLSASGWNPNLHNYHPPLAYFWVVWHSIEVNIVQFSAHISKCFCSSWYNHSVFSQLRPSNNGKQVPRWGVAEIQKMSPSTTGSRPIGARHGDTSANHTDLQYGCGRPCVFAVRVWSNLWDLIWLWTSHYSMVVGLCLLHCIVVCLF